MNPMKSRFYPTIAYYNKFRKTDYDYDYDDYDDYDYNHTITITILQAYYIGRLILRTSKVCQMQKNAH
jgi:hypothetical protein